MAFWGTSKLQGSNGFAGTRAPPAGTGKPALGQEGAGQFAGYKQEPGWKQAAWASFKIAPVGGLRPAAPATTGSSVGQKRGRPSCWYYDQGMCTRGDSCPFRHEGGADAAEANQYAATRLDAIRPVCWFYERGCCQKGAACNFKHQGARPQSLLTLKKMKLLEQDLQPDDPLTTAIKVALEPVGHLESEEELRKMRVRLPQYARSALQGLDLQRRPVTDIIEDYATNLYSRLIQTFGDRSWLPQADLMFILDSAIRELIPASKLAEIQPDALEVLIFTTHERVLDEQKAMLIVWDNVTEVVQGQKTRSKVYRACEVARKEAIADPEIGPDAAADVFARSWIKRTVGHLPKGPGGYAEDVLPCDAAIRLFDSFVDGGALPVRCMAELSRPQQGWNAWVSSEVRALYGPPEGEAVDQSGV